jgi:hypothetical protein
LDIPLKDADIERNRLMIEEAPSAAGRARMATRSGGVGREEEEKNVTLQYGCCSSRHTVLEPINRMQVAKSPLNPRIRYRSFEVGAVKPTMTKGTTDVARKKVRSRSSQNVNELEEKASAWRTKRAGSDCSNFHESVGFMW